MKSIAKTMDHLALFVRRNITIILATVAIAAGGTYYYQVKQERDFVNCQTEFNKSLAIQIKTRSILFQEADDNRDALIRGVGQIILSPPIMDKKELAKRSEKYRSLFTTYATDADLLDGERAKAKLPDLPTC